MLARLRATRTAFSAALRNRQLRRLQLAHALGDIAGWAGMTAIGVYAYDVGGATLLGVATFVRMIPGVVVGPVFAAIADRGSRVRVLAATTLARGVIGAVNVAVLVADAPAAVVLGVPLLSTALVSVWYPTKAALIPALSRSPQELTAANVMSSSIDSTSMFVGPAMAGLLLAVSGVELALAVSTAGTLLAGLAVLAIHEPARTATDEPTGDNGDIESAGGLVAETRAGFAEVWHQPRLRLLVSLMSLQLMVDGILNVLLVAVAFELLETGEGGVGALTSAIGVGGIIGAVAATTLAGTRRLAPAFLAGLVLWGLPLLIVGLLSEPVVALGMLALLGLGNTLLDVAGYTLLQRVTHDRIMARVFGVLESAATVTSAAGLLLAPALIAVAGVQGALLITGAFLPALALLSARSVIAADTPPADTVALIRAVDIFAPLPPTTLERLAAAAVPRTFAAGDTIVRQGDPGDRFYVIQDGGVEVVEDGTPVRTETVGESFGEIALIRDTARTATVTARAQTTLLGIDRDAFLAALSETPAAGELAERVAATRLGTARRIGMVPV